MRESYLYPGHYDLVTPDGAVSKIHARSDAQLDVEITIESISPAFVGYSLPKELISFNFKSTLAQIGLNGLLNDVELNPKQHSAKLHVTIVALSPLAKEMLPHLEEGAFVGKLFAADDRRLVKNGSYLDRMFGRNDREGRPLLSLGGDKQSHKLTIEQVDGRVVAFLTLKEGRMEYEETVHGFFSTLGRALKKKMAVRDMLRLHQFWQTTAPRIVEEGDVLLVSSQPLHIRTAFARVVDTLLPEGVKHTTANILQPDTRASGDIYELYGSSDKEMYDIPLEFFTLEPHREHVFFSDRDQLQECLEDPKVIFDTFENAPSPKDHRAAVFIVKGSQMLSLQPKDWITRNPPKQPFPGISQTQRQASMAERYIEQQPSYPFLKALEVGLITSQGVLFSRFFPSPLLKRMLLSYYVESHLMRIYFQSPSRSGGEFFSQEDRAVLNDLAHFGIPVYWADKRSGMILQYIQRPGKTTGFFVPLDKVSTFINATFFGIYGSNLTEGDATKELNQLFQGILAMKAKLSHPLLTDKTPLALVTGGGPGMMEVGNKLAKDLGILSCANIADFTPKDGTVVNEQEQNPYIEAKMTYRLDHLVERQAEFYLDFPIFLMGGIGTDFEFSLEEVRHKVGARPNSPILLFGPEKYWEEKITSRFTSNLNAGTIKGSEWVSNSFFCVENSDQALQIYRDYFENKLPIGKDGPIYDKGFVPPRNRKHP
ncbi:MAG: hypothetical protein S4CHLAM45_03400 [Chlamydiales bacterium]|nr:hypothetical protein [Chlamydiales bacterium]MCH9619196.1 hypothetical protein [Chlamydiales bacterium]MCH9622458.1 hypothetical protein [Chlamydiales bacterium]